MCAIWRYALWGLLSAAVWRHLVRQICIEISDKHTVSISLPWRRRQHIPPKCLQTTTDFSMSHSTTQYLHRFYSGNLEPQTDSMCYAVNSLLKFRLLWFRAAVELRHKAHASCLLHENMGIAHAIRKRPKPGVFSLYFELWYRLYYVVRTWGRQQVLPGWLAGRRAMPSSSKRTNEHWNAGARHHHNEKQAKKVTKQPT
jgi:hypothetical protein